MKSSIFIFCLSLSFLFLSCTQTNQLVYQPSFLASKGLPSKPTFENNLSFEDFYFEGYNSLKPITNSTLTKEENSNIQNLNISQYLVPAFSINLDFNNYFDPYTNYCYYNTYGVNSNYLRTSKPSGYYNGNYYSQYVNGWYWGVGAIAPSDGTKDFYHPSRNVITLQTFLTKTMNQKPNPLRNSPKEKSSTLNL